LTPDHPALIEAAIAACKADLRPRRLDGEDSRVMPGMAFEFRNDFFPDVDDTAFVLMALQRVDYRTSRAWKLPRARPCLVAGDAE